MSVNDKFDFSILFFIAMGLMALAAPTVAQTQPVDPTSYGMTSGRLVASSAAVLGLIGVVTGLVALFRPAGRFGTATGPLGAILTLAAGLVAAGVGVLKVLPAGVRLGGLRVNIQREKLQNGSARRDEKKRASIISIERSHKL